MKCPYCGSDDSKVVDSRPTDDKIRRRRECIRCRTRFTTYEIVEMPLLMVEKRDGTFEPFNRSKLINGIFSAIKKRPVTIDQVSQIADHIENHYANALKTVARSSDIGGMVLKKLKEIDSISYIRFASVYRDFTDIESFVAAISELDENKKISENAEKGVRQED